MAPLEALLDASKAVRHYQTHRTLGKHPRPSLFEGKGVFYCGAFIDYANRKLLCKLSRHENIGFDLNRT
jgi:hypothetical protein